eukprot:248318-Chlamydomonas_euryale.AAC.2
MSGRSGAPTQGYRVNGHNLCVASTFQDWCRYPLCKVSMCFCGTEPLLQVACAQRLHRLANIDSPTAARQTLWRQEGGGAVSYRTCVASRTAIVQASVRCIRLSFRLLAAGS